MKPVKTIFRGKHIKEFTMKIHISKTENFRNEREIENEHIS